MQLRAAFEHAVMYTTTPLKGVLFFMGYICVLLHYSTYTQD